MNPLEWLKAINEFRGRKFLITVGAGWMFYVGKLNEYLMVAIVIAYFVFDVIEKYTVHKTEEDCNEPVAKS